MWDIIFWIILANAEYQIFKLRDRVKMLEIKCGISAGDPADR